jgi:hypothetical protein
LFIGDIEIVVKEDVRYGAFEPTDFTNHEVIAPSTARAGERAFTRPTHDHSLYRSLSVQINPIAGSI